ncbi:hypothetical protein TKK_0004874 [Trichogramma kaykai]
MYHNVFFLAIFSALNCNASKLRIINGGIVNSIKIYPYQASLQHELVGHFCGGSIVHKHYVLSAAHCFYPNQEEELLDAEKIEVVVGSRNLKYNRGIRHAVEKILINPYYRLHDNVPYYGDLALVKLKKEITFSDKIQPIKLAKANHVVDDGQVLTFTGWGWKKVDAGEPEEYLRFAEMNVYNNDKCRKEWKDYVYENGEGDSKYVVIATKGMICLQGESNFCDGDSGGPLVDEHKVQVGVLSFNDKCGVDSELPSGATDLRIWTTWLSKYIHYEPSPKPTHPKPKPSVG